MSRDSSLQRWRGFPTIAIAPDGPFRRFCDDPPDAVWCACCAEAGLAPHEPCTEVAQTRWRGQDGLLLRVNEELLLACPPSSDALLPDDPVERGTPAPLRRLWSVFGGIGPVDGPRAVAWRQAILAPEDTRLLTRHVRFGEDTILYDPGALVVVVADQECLGCLDGDDRLRWWSATSHVLGPPLSLEAALRDVSARWGAT